MIPFTIDLHETKFILRIKSVTIPILEITLNVDFNSFFDIVLRGDSSLLQVFLNTLQIARAAFIFLYDLIFH